MLSYHVLVDTITDYELDQLLKHLLRYKPEYLQLIGSYNFFQAQKITEWLYTEIPEIRVILRQWPDDGLLKKFNYSASSWYHEIIEPKEDWLLKYKPVWLVDNESVEDDLTEYARCSNTIMEIMGQKGLGVAVGRFAAGNPKEDQYAQLDPIWQGLKKWDGLHIWSPNEYFDMPALGFGSGSIARYQLGINRCLDEFDFTPEIVIGEFGLANHYDPFSGWRDTNLSEEEYANLCLAYDRIWYEPKGITACVFSVGKWKSFDVGNKFFKTVEENYKPIEIPDIPIDEPKKETNMLETILNILRDNLLNRKFLTSVLTPLISWALLQIPNFPFTPDQVTAVAITIILTIVGMDGIHDTAQVISGKTWNSKSRKWE